MTDRKLRMGMIGGGPGSFIGAIHHKAAIMDGQVNLVCGAFSSDAEKSKQTGAALHIPALRVYGSYKEMFTIEKALTNDERMDFVSIVTPNHLHFEPAKIALQNGFHVVLDKPLTYDLKEAKELKQIAEQSGKYLCVTYTYTGYPMIKEARQQVLKGSLGKIRKIYVEYHQGWLSSFEEGKENKQAMWRTDPLKSGRAGAIGDIGTHAFHLAEYVSGLQVTHLCANLNTYVKGRKLDDDGDVLLKFDNGATGVLVATQIATGAENNIKIRVYGENGGLEWQHLDANTLMMSWPDRPAEILRSGADYLTKIAKHNTRIPPGHPEGYIEAFANHYRNFSLCIKAKMNKIEPKEEWLDFPNVTEGVRGMAFIESVVNSGKSNNKWTEYEI